jgi:small nuclear ribonucleoprotein D3
VSVSGKRGVGIPVILLHDAEGGIVTIELKSGDTYRGFLEESQDNMNCTMKDCTKVNAADGKESHVQIAYIRGSQISFIILPDMLQKAPFFNRIKLWRKHKGHAVMGTNTVGPIRGQAAAIAQKSRERKFDGGVGGGPGGAGGGGGRGFPPPMAMGGPYGMR